MGWSVDGLTTLAERAVAVEKACGALTTAALTRLGNPNAPMSEKELVAFGLLLAALGYRTRKGWVFEPGEP